MAKFKVLFLTLLVLSQYSMLSGQNQTNYWFFGENAGLNFNTTPPTVITNSNMKTFEACSSISDKNGNLLFYTNGGSFTTLNYVGGVWNKIYHQLILVIALYKGL
jgi:hypothetical protein